MISRNVRCASVEFRNLRGILVLIGPGVALAVKA